MKLEQSNTWVFRLLWHETKIHGPKVFLLTKVKAEYSDMMYNRTHFSGHVVFQIREVPLYINIDTMLTLMILLI